MLFIYSIIRFLSLLFLFYIQLMQIDKKYPQSDDMQSFIKAFIICLMINKTMSNTKTTKNDDIMNLEYLISSVMNIESININQMNQSMTYYRIQ